MKLTHISLFVILCSYAAGASFSVSKAHETPSLNSTEMRIATTKEILHVENTAILSLADVANAQYIEQDELNYIIIKLTPDGKAKFERASGESIGSRLAIVVSDELISAPRIMQKVSTDSIQVTGLPADTAKKVVAILNRK